MIPGRGCLTGLIGLVLVVAAIGDGADIAARHYATSKIADRIKAADPDVQGVHAHIRSFPFLKVGFSGHVDEIGARIAEVVVGPLAFTNVDVELHGLKISASKLLNKHQVDITGISTGTVTAMITADALTKAVGVPVSIGNGGFLVRGVEITVNVSAAAREVTIGGAVPLRAFALPGPDLLPCVPSVAFTGQAVTLSCTFTHVPSAFTSVAT